MTIDQAGMHLTEGYEAVNIAHSLTSGKGFSAPWRGAGSTAWVTPALPTILATDMLIFGPHTRTTLIMFVLFNELCSALTIFPVFFAAKRIAGMHGIAALAAWIFALNPLAAETACKNIWYTTLSGLLAALLLWATLAVRGSRKPVAWIGYGLIWGTQLMTHPSFLVLMPVAMLWLIWKRISRARVALVALTCVVAFLCCVPWTVRNFAVFHHFVPLRSDFGFELWRYNHDGPPTHPNRPGSESDAFSSLGEYAYVHEKQGEALAWIRAHPGFYLFATVRRVKYFWLDEFPHHPLRRFVHRGAGSFKVKFLYICAMLPMILSGLVVIRRNRREYFWLLASFPAVFPLVYYMTLARDFHRSPIDPVLAIIAAFAMTPWLTTQSCNGSVVGLERPYDTATIGQNNSEPCSLTSETHR